MFSLIISCSTNNRLRRKQNGKCHSLKLKLIFYFHVTINVLLELIFVASVWLGFGTLASIPSVSSNDFRMALVFSCGGIFLFLKHPQTDWGIKDSTTGRNTIAWNSPNKTVRKNTLKNVISPCEVESERSITARNVVIPPFNTAVPIICNEFWALTICDPVN